MILVDTSVWVDYLRNGESNLEELINTNQVCMHSAIIGELACGNLQNRKDRINDWKALPTISELQNGDVIALIENKKLMGKGIGLIDAHLLGAVLNQPGTLIWTRDRKLLNITTALGVAYDEARERAS